MKNYGSVIKQHERSVQYQRLDSTEFGEEFTFDQKRWQTANLENQERRNYSR